MGGKLSKKKLSRRGGREVACVPSINIDEDDDEHIYQNADELTDIDPVDGTYYQHIDQSNLEIHHDHCYSLDTLGSWDSAFSDKSDTSKESNISKTSVTSHTNPKQHSTRDHVYTTTDHNDYLALSNFARTATSRKRVSRRRPFSKHGYVSASETYVSSYGWKRTCEAPIERVVFLVEAFEPLITGSLNVIDIIPHLVFIEDTETFREKHRESPREAVSLLIQRLKDCEEPGKWRTFLDALKSAGYEYIANLLLEETEADHTINKRILRLFTPALIKRIDPEEFIDHLLAEDVISDIDREEIQCEKRNRGNIAASLMLLEKVPRRLENWFEIFVEVLEKCGLEDLIENFRVPVVSVESRKVHQESQVYDEDRYYLTPCDDEDQMLVSPLQKKMRDSSKSSRTKEGENIQRLKNERDRISKTLEHMKEIRNLESDIRRMKMELENLNEDEGGSIKSDSVPERRPDGMKPNQTSTVKHNTLEDQNMTSQPEISNSTTAMESQLERIANGVEGISDLLKDAFKAKTATANSEYTYQMPLPHRLNGHDSTTTDRYYRHRSLDSAISMGYILPTQVSGSDPMIGNWIPEHINPFKSNIEYV